MKTESHKPHINDDHVSFLTNLAKHEKVEMPIQPITVRYKDLRNTAEVFLVASIMSFPEKDSIHGFKNNTWCEIPVDRITEKIRRIPAVRRALNGNRVDNDGKIIF
jgi:hypothetical protein